MEVKRPKLGEGADSGVVVGIFVKEGDTMAKGQTILELENEKAVAAIPSTAAGVVENIHGGDVKFESVIPAVVFTDPELAWCGLTEAEAKAQNNPHQIAKFPWTVFGRAL